MTVDAVLIEKVLQQDRIAMGQMMRLYGGAMLAAARSLCPQYADDIVQEAWIAAIGALPQFEQKSSLKTWLIRSPSTKPTTTCANNALKYPWRDWLSKMIHSIISLMSNRIGGKAGRHGLSNRRTSYSKRMCSKNVWKSTSHYCPKANVPCWYKPNCWG
jgi:hypothetical protein